MLKTEDLYLLTNTKNLPTHSIQKQKARRQKTRGTKPVYNGGFYETNFTQFFSCNVIIRVNQLNVIRYLTQEIQNASMGKSPEH